MEGVFAVLADEGELLRDAAVLIARARVEIGLRKVAVLVEHFAVPKRDGLPRFGAHRDGCIAREILSEVDNRFTVRRFEYLAGEVLVLTDGHALGAHEIVIAEILDFHAVPVRDGLHARVLRFAELGVVLAHDARLACFPRGIATHDGLAADLEATQERDVLAGDAVGSVDAVVPAVDSVAERDADLVFAFVQKVGHIIAL